MQSNVFLKDKMKIGIIGISGKGKSTLLNHLIDKEVALELVELIGPENKENELSGQTKNPVRYKIKRDNQKCEVVVSQVIEDSYKDTIISLGEAVQYAKSSEKCTITINVTPSFEFEEVMSRYYLNEIEFIDTQGLLDTLDGEVSVPLEIKECSVLLYLYDKADQGNRGDYIKKYRNFLNSISEKPLIFLETSIQWQIKKKILTSLATDAADELRELDLDFSISDNTIRNRYSILTGNNAYTNNDTFILSSVLSAEKSSVNFYNVKLPSGVEEYKDECLRICSAHTINEVFKRLNGLKEGILREFDKVNKDFNRTIGFNACYGLLWDVFVMKWQRIDNNTNSRVLRYGRHDFNRFIRTLKAFNEGKLFDVDFTTTEYEIHTPYGYHFIYETYKNQNVLDCMQLLLDLYNAYLQRLSIKGSKLSKAVQVYLIRSVSSDRMCRDTGYEIPILDEKTFIHCMGQLKKWIGDIPVNLVRYKKFEEFDISYTTKNQISNEMKKHSINIDSLITKLDYVCMLINNKMNNKAIDKILHTGK